MTRSQKLLEEVTPLAVFFGAVLSIGSIGIFYHSRLSQLEERMAGTEKKFAAELAGTAGKLEERMTGVTKEVDAKVTGVTKEVDAKVAGIKEASDKTVGFARSSACVPRVALSVASFTPPPPAPSSMCTASESMRPLR